MKAEEEMKIITAYAKRQKVTWLPMRKIHPMFPCPLDDYYSQTDDYIIVDKRDNRIIDGNHRYCEAVEDGVTTLGVKLVDPTKVRKLPKDSIWR